MKEIKKDVYPNYLHAMLSNLRSETAKDLAEDVILFIKAIKKENNHLLRIHLQEMTDSVESIYGVNKKELYHQVHKVCLNGAEKHGMASYLKAPFSFKARINSAFRHILDHEISPNEPDHESGLMPLYHFLANIYMIYEVVELGSEEKIKESNDLDVVVQEKKKVPVIKQSFKGVF